MQFDWPVLMRAAITERGLTPSEFWSLTPAELSMVLGEGGPKPLDRAGLDALLREFPDDLER